MQDADWRILSDIAPATAMENLKRIAESTLLEKRKPQHEERTGVPRLQCERLTETDFRPGVFSHHSFRLTKQNPPVDEFRGAFDCLLKIRERKHGLAGVDACPSPIDCLD
jgi:hypothetical protein